MAVSQTKLKTLYVLEILMTYTDENHIMTANEIADAVKKLYGLEIERKSMYGEIETLIAYGVDIEQIKGKNSGYYVASRTFELPELKLLVDAVASSKFITAKKSEALINKLERLANKYTEGQLKRQVFIYNRPKADNEKIYYVVDAIHAALASNKQIAFKYVDWTPDKKQVVRHGGEVYKVSPWALTWDDENYYLIAFDSNAGIIKHFRVDKMRDTELCDDSRDGESEFKSFDLPSYSKKMFGMFAGRDEKVTLKCKDSLAGVIIDRFGKDVMIVPGKDGYFGVSASVSISPQFFGWVTSIGPDLKLEGPSSVVDEYKKFLNNIIKNY